MWQITKADICNWTGMVFLTRGGSIAIEYKLVNWEIFIL